jgi:23S rRNA pseudouridine2605 synthase
LLFLRIDSIINLPYVQREDYMLERLQKIISAAGVTSRRAAEELITEGRVRVNGTVVTELGTKADASKDHIKVDGKLINPKQPPTYIMLNKPAGFVTTMSDPEGRPTVQDLMRGVKVRVYPVGRLDYNTEGMLILTNDGDFAHMVTHPKHELPKTYLAKIKGILDEKAIESLEMGVFLDDGKTAPAKIKKIRKEEANSWVEITIHEGRKRQVRRMFDRVGRSVIKLKRIKTGSLVLGDLPEGTFRYLTQEEVQGLKEMSQRTEVRSPEPVVRTQKAEIRPQRAAEIGRDERRPTSVRGPKVVHKGKPDARPWRAAERGEEKRRETTDERRGGRRGARSVQDTGAGRRNQAVRPWKTAERGEERRRETSDAGRRPSFGPRKDNSSRPPFRTSTSKPLSRTAAGKSSMGAAPWKSDAGKKPGVVRPWKAAERGVERRESGGRGPKRTYGSQSDGGRGAGTSTRGPARAGSWAPRQGSTTGRNRDTRSSGASRGPQGEERRPSSGPRPNKGNRPRGNRPGQGARPTSRGRGPTAGGRGPRR